MMERDVVLYNVHLPLTHVEANDDERKEEIIVGFRD